MAIPFINVHQQLIMIPDMYNVDIVHRRFIPRTERVIRIAILYHQAERYRRLSLSLHPIPRDVHAEHQGIFDATMARDSEKAAAVLTEHIVSTFQAFQALPTITDEKSGSDDSVAGCPEQQHGRSGHLSRETSSPHPDLHGCR